MHQIEQTKRNSFKHLIIGLLLNDGKANGRLSLDVQTLTIE